MEKERKIEENIMPFFPVSNFILLPKVRAPLVVSDEKYKALVFESAAKSKFIGIFSTSRSYTKSSKEDMGVYPIGCAGKIISVSEIASGVFSVVVEGVFRIKILDFLKGETYSNIKFEILNEILPDIKVQEELKREMIENAVKFLVRIGESKERIAEISQIANNMSFEETLNWAIFLHPLRFTVKLSLISEDNLEVRARKFIGELKKDIFYFDLLAEYRDLKPRDPRVN